ncbi:MAG TPA: response regulator [Polyangia bacterium]|nr:response regulator [Polyangia bacterium]
MFRVLMVDDDADINESVRAGLVLAGFDAVGAPTGRAALEEIRRQQPDLVLLDQMLPDIDGVEICRRLRAAPETKRLPVVFLTARAGQEARIGGLALGADDYIVKPFSLQELVLRIRAVLRRATPVDLQLPPQWVQLRDQFRVWNGYAEIHAARGEWRDCLELSRSILLNCGGALSPDERGLITRRLLTCAEHLGDLSEQRIWQERARGL